MTDHLLEALAACDTCAVSDALDRLALPGVVTGIAAMGVPRRIVGRVVPVELAPLSGGVPARHLGTAAVDASGPGDVLVVAHHGRSDVSGWGGLLTLGARTRGVEGVIVDGACRDPDDFVALDFPVYARGAVPTSARGRVAETSWDQPVTIDGVRVEPHDLVIADRSGVVFVSYRDAEAVLSEAAAILTREVRIAERIREGVPMQEAMGANYERHADR